MAYQVADEPLELTEPAYDVPPMFKDADERRMHVRAYNYWASLLRGRAFPSIADLDPASLDDFGPNSVLLDFTKDRESPVLRFVGKRLRQECELPAQDVALADVPPRSLISRLTDHYFEILANRAPIGFEAEFVSQRGLNTLYRGILMPLSSDGRAIDFIYGVINWKEVADVELAAELVAEVAEALAAFAPTMEPEAEPFEAVPPADAGLADRLAHARTAAEAVKSADARSRGALYRALADAYDFHLAAQAEPDDFAELLADAGLAAQARAPLTPIVKLVFGADYDKARVTEFAAALSFAARQAVDLGGFAAFIETADGGLKGLVQAERAARRTEQDKPAEDRAATARARLRKGRAAAHVALPADGDDEFVLLVARREAGGALAVLEAVPDGDKLVDMALRKLGAPSCRRLDEAA